MATMEGPAPTTTEVTWPAKLMRLSGERIAWLLTLLVVAWLVVVPLGMLLIASFKSTQAQLPFDSDSFFSLQNYIKVFGSSVTYRLLANSFIFSIAAVALAMLISCTFAWFLQRTDIPFRRLLLVMLISPMAIPPAVTAMAWTLLGSPTIGLYNRWLNSLFGLGGSSLFDIYGLGGMIFVTALTVVPSFYLIISPVFNRIDPSLEEASEICGVSRLKTLRRVTIPLLAPALAGAAIFYFILVLESFEVPAILGLPKRIFVFSTLIYQATEPSFGLPDYGSASTYGVLTLCITLLLLYAYSRLVRNRERYAVITGKGYRPRIIRLSPLVRWISLSALLTYLLLTVLVPFLVLVWASLLPYYSVPSWPSLSRVSLENFRQLARYPGISLALWNTAILFVVAAAATTVIAAIASRMSVRAKFTGNSLPDHLTIVVIAVPSVVLGLALRLVYASLPLPIYGTIWIIAIACVTRFLSNGTRVMTPAFLQIHPSLEEASSASGVSQINTLRRILAPLLAPALFSVWLWTAVHAAREIPMSVMLANANSQTLGVALWQIWTQAGNIGLAAALAVLLTIGSAIGTFFVAKLVLLRRTSESD